MTKKKHLRDALCRTPRDRCHGSEHPHVLLRDHGESVASHETLRDVRDGIDVHVQALCDE